LDHVTYGTLFDTDRAALKKYRHFRDEGIDALIFGMEAIGPR